MAVGLAIVLVVRPVAGLVTSSAPDLTGASAGHRVLGSEGWASPTTSPTPSPKSLPLRARGVGRRDLRDPRLDRRALRHRRASARRSRRRRHLTRAAVLTGADIVRRCRPAGSGRPSRRCGSEPAERAVDRRASDLAKAIGVTRSATVSRRSWRHLERRQMQPHPPVPSWVDTYTESRGDSTRPIAPARVGRLERRHLGRLTP